jgi:hypothetical protein
VFNQPGAAGPPARTQDVGGRCRDGAGNRTRGRVPAPEVKFFPSGPN